MRGSESDVTAASWQLMHRLVDRARRASLRPYHLRELQRLCRELATAGLEVQRRELPVDLDDPALRDVVVGLCRMMWNDIELLADVQKNAPVLLSKIEAIAGTARAATADDEPEPVPEPGLEEPVSEPDDEAVAEQVAVAPRPIDSEDDLGSMTADMRTGSSALETDPESQVAVDPGPDGPSCRTREHAGRRRGSTPQTVLMRMAKARRPRKQE